MAIIIKSSEGFKPSELYKNFFMKEQQKQIVTKTVSELGLGNIYYYAAQKLLYLLEKRLTRKKETPAKREQIAKAVAEIKANFKPLVLPEKAKEKPDSVDITEQKLSSLTAVKLIWDFMYPDFIEYHKEEQSEEQKQILEKIAKELNYGSIHGFINRHLKFFLKRKISQCESGIEYYKQKYGFESFETLTAKFHDLTEFDIIEKEDDEMRWESDVIFSKSYNELLNEINHG